MSLGKEAAYQAALIALGTVLAIIVICGGIWLAGRTTYVEFQRGGQACVIQQNSLNDDLMLCEVTE